MTIQTSESQDVVRNTISPSIDDRLERVGEQRNPKKYDPHNMSTRDLEIANIVIE